MRFSLPRSLEFLSASRRVYNPRLRMVNKTQKSNDDSHRVQHAVDADQELLERAVLKLDGNVWGLVFGILLGLMIFVATNFLLIKGGEVIGPHLGLLSQFLFGYSVSFVGSLIGFGYGLLYGYVAGFVTAWVYNRVVALKRG
jgi:tetrahydromethanopterin S-methyltransferase subunit G